jgi:hypothetical protein
MNLLALNASERKNFELHVRDFFQDNEIALKAFVLAEISQAISAGKEMERILDLASTVLATLDQLYNHLDKHKVKVNDTKTYEGKCRELAKVILSCI